MTALWQVFVRLAAFNDLPRIDRMMGSEPLKKRLFEECLVEERLHGLFFRMLRCFPLSRQLLEELLRPYPELHWTLELNEARPTEWPCALHSVKEIALKAVQRSV